MGHQSTFRRQHGAVLIVGLILLVVISLLGATGYSMAVQQERIAGNTRDKAIAFEAAESSLRDCESLLSGVTRPATDGSVVGVYTAAAVGSTPKYQSVDWDNVAQVRVMTTAIDGTAKQPRCVIEDMGIVTVLDSSINPHDPSLEQRFVYRITATGYGLRPQTIAVVQSHFSRINN